MNTPTDGTFALMPIYLAMRPAARKRKLNRAKLDRVRSEQCLIWVRLILAMLTAVVDNSERTLYQQCSLPKYVANDAEHLSSSKRRGTTVWRERKLARRVQTLDSRNGYSQQNELATFSLLAFLTLTGTECGEKPRHEYFRISRQDPAIV